LFLRDDISLIGFVIPCLIRAGMTGSGMINVAVYNSTHFQLTLYPHSVDRELSCEKLKTTSKNVIPAKAGIQKRVIILDSRLRGSDKFGIIRGSLKT